MKRIATSENIKTFITRDFIYVDKTEFIYKLVSNHERVFFSRPRRFGKSLTLNIIGTLFEKGPDPYFKKTWIYDKWDLGTCPVLKINFLNCPADNPAEFKRSLCIIIKNALRRMKITDYQDDSEPNILINNAFSALEELDRQIVIIIDEYDSPLTANLDNPKLYKEYHGILHNFFAVLKGKEQIRFLAVAGVTRLKDVSLFSVGSDIEDLSYANDFSQMIGFTREEIRNYYSEYLKLGVMLENSDKNTDKNTEVTDSQIEIFLDKMAAYYDGFCFDEFHENKVFCTWSVNKFLSTIYDKKRVVFDNYWYLSGGLPSILVKYLDSHNLDTLALGHKELEISYDDFMNPATLPTMNSSVLMCQTGYLTLKSSLEQSPPYVNLGFANRETLRSLSALLSLRIFKSINNISNKKKENILDCCSTEELVNIFNQQLASVVYDQYPVTGESSVQALLQIYLQGLGIDVRCEQHNSKGRSDLIINLTKRRIVIELKYSAEGKGIPYLLNEAFEQLKRNEYGVENLGSRELLRIAAVFSAAGDQRKIVSFKELNQV